MTPLQALDRAHQAWLATQPQYVIPGVLDSAPLTDSKNGTRREHACRTGRTIEPANPSPQHLSPAVGGLVTARPDIRADGVSSRPAAQHNPQGDAS